MRSIPSQRFPQRCFWNASNVRLIDDGAVSSFSRKIVWRFLFPCLSPQAISELMSLALCPQVVSQASQHFRSFREASHLWGLLCPPFYLLGRFPSLRHVDRRTCSSRCWLELWGAVGDFALRLFNSFTAPSTLYDVTGNTLPSTYRMSSDFLVDCFKFSRILTPYKVPQTVRLVCSDFSGDWSWEETTSVIQFAGSGRVNRLQDAAKPTFLFLN